MFEMSCFWGVVIVIAAVGVCSRSSGLVLAASWRTARVDGLMSGNDASVDAPGAFAAAPLSTALGPMPTAATARLMCANVMVVVTSSYIAALDGSSWDQLTSSGSTAWSTSACSTANAWAVVGACEAPFSPTDRLVVACSGLTGPSILSIPMSGDVSGIVSITSPRVAQNVVP